jgi:hypothetical protein
VPNPSSYPNAVIWQPTPASLVWTGAVGSVNVAAVDDLVQNAESQISSRVWTQTTASLKPKWKGDGWMWCGTDSAVVRRMGISGVTSICNHFHVNGTGHFLARFKVDAVTAAFKCIAANCRMTTAHRGFGVRLNSSGVISLSLYNTAASAFFSINAGTVSDTNEHAVEFILAAGPNACKARLDFGAWTTATMGTLTTGNATDDLTIGCRSLGLLDPFNGQIRDLVIASSQLPDQYVDDWRNRLFGGGEDYDPGGLSLGLGLGI